MYRSSARCWSVAFSLAVTVIACDGAWAVTSPPGKMQAFPNRQWGNPEIVPVELPARAAARARRTRTLTALAQLGALPGAEEARVVYNEATGLARSISDLRVAMPGDSLEAKARAFLGAQRNLLLAGGDADDLIHEQTRIDSYQCGHVDFAQSHLGLKVYGGGVSVHFDRDENITLVNGDFLPAVEPLNGGLGGQLSADDALHRALRRLGNPPARAHGDPELALFAKSQAKGGALLAWRYQLVGGPLAWEYVLFADARSGDPLEFYSTTTFADGTAAVFDPHRQANNNTPVARTITDLDGSGLLRGPLAVVYDEENARAQSGTLSFQYPPAAAEFVQSCVYYYVTETRKRLRALGFNDQTDGAIPSIVNALDANSGGGFNNAFFTPLGVGFVFGNGDQQQLANLAADFDVAAHEFGHFFDYVLRGRVLGNDRLHSPRRAWGEAVGDTVAAVINGDPNIGETTRIGRPYLRTMENAKRFPNDLQNEEHADGEIFAGANWDLMKLIGGGTVTPAARDMMARVMIAGIPNLPQSNTRFNDVLIALLTGVNNIPGLTAQQRDTLRAQLRQAYNQRGIAETAPVPRSAAGPRRRAALSLADDDYLIELKNGIPLVGSLPDSLDLEDNLVYAAFYVRVPQGATSLRLQTFVPGVFEIGDVILLAAPSNFQSVHDVYTADDGYVVEQLVITNSSPVPLSRDSTWLVVVADYPDGSYSEVGIVAAIEGGGPQLTQIAIGQQVAGTIRNVNQQDLYYFEGTAGQYVDVRVNRTSQSFDPMVILADARGQILITDDDSGGNFNALIANYRIPASDFYLVAVQSAVTAQGPLTTGGYTLLVSSSSAPPPTATPRATPAPGTSDLVQPGQPITRAIGPATQQNGGAGTSDQFRVVVPPGATELVLQVQGSATPRNKLILQARRGRPIDPRTFDDHIGLGSRKNTIVLTPNTRLPLTPGEYYLMVFNLLDQQQNFTLSASITGGAASPTPTHTAPAATATPTNTMGTFPTATPTATPTRPANAITPNPDVDGNGIVDADDLLWIMKYWHKPFP